MSNFGQTYSGTQNNFGRSFDLGSATLTTLGIGYHVKDTGAVGDDTTDDTAAINTAIAAVQSAGRGTVWLGSKSYLISDNLRITAGRITLKGEPGSKIRMKPGIMKLPIAVGVSVVTPTVITDVTLDGIEIDGGYYLQTLNNGASSTIGSVTSATSTTVTVSGAAWTVNAFAGMYINIINTAASARNQVVLIVSNTATTITVPAWTSGTPQAADLFTVTTGGKRPTTANSIEDFFSVAGIGAIATHRLRIINCFVHDVMGTGVSVEECGQFMFRGNVVDNVGLTQDCSRAAGQERNHLTIIGSSPDTNGYPDNWYVVSNNIFRRVSDVCIDLHGRSDDGITCVGNTIGGRSLTSTNVLAGNTGAPGLWGIAVEMEAADTVNNGRLTITGNEVRDVGTGVVVNCAPVTQPWQTETVSIVGNAIHDMSNSGIQAIGSNLTIAANAISRYGLLSGGAATGRGIGIGSSGGGAQPMTYRNIAITGNPISAGGVSAPKLGTITTSTSGGTLPAATQYFYKITAINKVANALGVDVQYATGESKVSNEVSVTTGAGATNKNTIPWTAMPNATGYKIYRGTTTNTEQLLTTITNPNITSFVDTGALTPSGVMPVANTTGMATQCGIYLDAQGSDIVDTITIANNPIDGAGIDFQSGNLNAGVNFQQPTLYRGVIIGQNAIQHHQYAIGGGVDYMKVLGNHIANNNDHGMNLVNAAVIVAPLIQSNTVLNNGQNPSSGNPFGVRLRTTNAHVLDNIITDNQTSKTQNWALGFAGTPLTTGTVIRGGTMAGNNSGTIATSAGSAIGISDLTINSIRMVEGVSPKGNFTAPAVPATTVAYTNTTNYDAMVTIFGGTVTVIAIGGVATGLTSGSFVVPANQTITLTYSVAPTWVWYGS